MNAPTGRRADCYIFDMDGTLADCQHRIHHIQAGDGTLARKKDWPSFWAGVPFDTPIPHMVRTYKVLRYSTAESYAYGMSIIIVSGRAERCRVDTLEWLERNELSHDGLFMRRDGDYRDDATVKSELLDQILHLGWKPIMAFDDRKRVVDMWRARGIPCAQVAPGDF